MRIAVHLLVLSTIACFARAQCLGSTGGTNVVLTPTIPPIAANDEGRSAPLPLGFAFPMTGAAPPTWSHAVVDANGVLYLTNGGAAVGTADFGAGNGVDDLRGGPGGSPRVFALWSDLEGIAPGYAVTVDTSVPGRFRVNWVNVEEIGSGGPQYSFAISLFANGSVELAYGTLPNAYGYGGISIGNDVGTGSETSSDLEAGASSGTLGLLFEEYDGLSVPTVSAKAITITPNGAGGYQSAATCRAAENRPFGTGCYSYEEANEAVYERFPNVAQSFAALPPGTSIQFTIAGPGYFVTNGGGTFVAPPPSAVVLTLSDDSSVSVTPSQPFPHANGTAYPVISVCSNGFVSMAPAGVNPNGTGGSVSSLLNAPAPSFRSQRDYNPAPAASGKVKRHEAVAGSSTILYVTWDNVFVYNTTTPERFQIQLDLTTGTVTMVWDLMTSVTPPTSKPLLVGCAAGDSFDPGPIVLATQLPVLTFPDVELLPLALSASPAPVVNPATTVTFTIDNIPEFVPGAGLRLAGVFLSFGQLPGVDLAALGAPGCNAYLPTLDLLLPTYLGASPTGTTGLTVTSAIPPGSIFYSQAFALFDPAFPLVNGQNAFGLLTSNGLRSVVQTF